MIGLQLQGQLGNQLFQYAAARVQAERLGCGLVVESMFAGQLDDHLSELAHHYRHSDNANKAIEYLGRAGQQAMQRSANADAVASLSVAIDLLQKLPDSAERTHRQLLLQSAVSICYGKQRERHFLDNLRLTGDRLQPEQFGAVGLGRHSSATDYDAG